MGGVLFSNFYFHICVGKQREEQKKSTSWITGGAGTLVSPALRVGIKDLSANNLFLQPPPPPHYPTPPPCNFPFLSPSDEAFFVCVCVCGGVPNDKYCAFIKSWEGIFRTQGDCCMRPHYSPVGLLWEPQYPAMCVSTNRKPGQSHANVICGGWFHCGEHRRCRTATWVTPLTCHPEQKVLRISENLKFWPALQHKKTRHTDWQAGCAKKIIKK